MSSRDAARDAATRAFREDGPAVLATLAYRLFSYWLPIPIGGLTWWLFRRRHPAGAQG